MNKEQAILDIFNVKIQEPFEVVDKYNKVLGIFMFSKNFQNELVMMKLNKSSTKWIDSNDLALGTTIVSILRNKVSINLFNEDVQQVTYKMYRYNVKHHAKKAYPVYINEVKKINEKTIRVIYIDCDEQEYTKYYNAYSTTKGKHYCRFGSTYSNRLYEGYTGRLILCNVSKEKAIEINKVAKKYGTEIEIEK